MNDCKLKSMIRGGGKEGGYKKMGLTVKIKPISASGNHPFGY